jgi:hypothetical protein
MDQLILVNIFDKVLYVQWTTKELSKPAKIYVQIQWHYMLFLFIQNCWPVYLLIPFHTFVKVSIPF